LPTFPRAVTAEKQTRFDVKSLYRFCTFAAMAQMQEALNQGHEVQLFAL
jgi:hypothetical protein